MKSRWMCAVGDLHNNHLQSGQRCGRPGIAACVVADGGGSPAASCRRPGSATQLHSDVSIAAGRSKEQGSAAPTGAPTPPPLGSSGLEPLSLPGSRSTLSSAQRPQQRRACRRGCVRQQRREQRQLLAPSGAAAAPERDSPARSASPASQARRPTPAARTSGAEPGGAAPHARRDRQRQLGPLGPRADVTPARRDGQSGFRSMKCTWFASVVLSVDDALLQHDPLRLVHEHDIVESFQTSPNPSSSGRRPDDD